MLPESRPLSSCKTASQVYGTCYACKWWGRRANRKKVEWRVCNFLDRDPGSLLEGWYCDELCTAATFGCVHFEPKPTENTDT